MRRPVDELPSPTQNPTSGGSSDTEVNEPIGEADLAVAARAAVMTVTPVGKCPSTWRKRAVSNAASRVAAWFGRPAWLVGRARRARAFRVWLVRVLAVAGSASTARSADHSMTS